jgi:hypothetical protein
MKYSQSESEKEFIGRAKSGLLKKSGAGIYI